MGVPKIGQNVTRGPFSGPLPCMLFLNVNWGGGLKIGENVNSDPVTDVMNTLENVVYVSGSRVPPPAPRVAV